MSIWRRLAGLFLLLMSGFVIADDITIDSSSVIYCTTKGRVYNTIVYETAIALGIPDESELKVINKDILKPDAIFITSPADTQYFSMFVQKGLTNLHNLMPGRDAYEIFTYNGTVVLLGNTPRGLLQAVYKLQEIVKENNHIDELISIAEAFHFDKRIFHGRFSSWPSTRSDIRYISHLGATHLLVTHDWQGNLRHFWGYVDSDIFPNAMEKSAIKNNNEKLHKMVENCKDYGLELALWITELPCQGGPWTAKADRQHFLERFGKDILSDSGTYEGQVLCFSQPKVQSFYKEIIRKFFDEFPEFSIIYVFGLDSGGEFCSPEKCSLCKGMSEYEQRDRFLKFLAAECDSARPGVKILTTNWGWAHRKGAQEFIDRQKILPAEVGVYLAAEYDGWQSERQINDFMMNVAKTCKNRKQLLIGYDNFHWGDDSVHKLKDIQDFPLGVGAKIQRWQRLGVDGIFDHWGTWPEDVPTNSIACREFFINPLADPKHVCKEIALRQFGQKAGQKVFESWCYLEKAHRIISNACTWSPSQWFGWYQGKKYSPTFANYKKHGLGKGLFEKRANNFAYNAGEIRDQLWTVHKAWLNAFPYYQKATAAMEQAYKIADEKELFYSYWWDGPKKTPTIKEHIKRQKLFIESVGLTGLQIGLDFGMRKIWLDNASNEADYKKAVKGLMARDIEACKAIAEFFDKVEKEEYTRADLSKWEYLYRKRAQETEKYLRDRSAVSLDVNF